MTVLKEPGTLVDTSLVATAINRNDDDLRNGSMIPAAQAVSNRLFGFWRRDRRGKPRSERL